MHVTDIKEITKQKSRVIVDDQFAFVLYKGELRRYGLKVGQPVNDETYREIMEVILVKRAKLRVMHLLQAMGRTEAQIIAKLRLGEYPEEVIQKAVEYVKKFGYINDQQYTEFYIEGRIKSKSRKQITLELQRKGIQKEQIQLAYEQIGNKYDEESLIAVAIQKHLNKRKIDLAIASREDIQKAIQSLMRKGYSFSDIQKVMKNSTKMIEDDIWQQDME